MTKAKRFISLFSALIMMMSILLSAMTVSAANVCYNVNGNLTNTVTFKATVGGKIFSSEKIVLTQSKGMTKQSWYGKQKEVGMYGRFYVSVYDETSKKWVYNNTKWKSKTFTIKSSKLKKNHSYTITVKGDTNQYVGDSYSYAPYVFKSWKSYPTWSATKTGGNISFCGY